MPKFEMPDGGESTKKPETAEEDVLSLAKKFRETLVNRRREEITKAVALARKLIENRERLSFPGIDPNSYQKLRAEEEEFPGCATPIDELVQRLKNEGMRIVFGNDPESGNIYILPWGSNDVKNDSILPKSLQVVEGMDRRLKELILLDRS